MKRTIIQTEGMESGVHNPFRLCLHTSNGRTQIAKICISGYNCQHCAFEQWLDAMEERQVAENGSKMSKNTFDRAA
jgi:hypothetical protein